MVLDSLVFDVTMDLFGNSTARMEKSKSNLSVNKEEAFLPLTTEPGNKLNSSVISLPKNKDEIDPEENLGKDGKVEKSIEYNRQVKEPEEQIEDLKSNASDNKESSPIIISRSIVKNKITTTATTKKAKAIPKKFSSFEEYLSKVKDKDKDLSNNNNNVDNNTTNNSKAHKGNSDNASK